MIPARTPSADVDSDRGPETGDRLPRSVEDVRQNFIATVQAMAVVTTLFAGIQAQLLSGIPSAPSPTAPQAVINALLLVSYGGLSVNVGAALSAMLFLDISGEAPEAFRRLRATASQASGRRSPSSHTGSITSTRTAVDTGLGLLLNYGSPRSLQFAWYHCVASTIFGTFSILLQICLLAWINLASQVSGVFVVVVLALFWAALPLPGLLLYNFCVGFITSLRKELQ